MHVRKEGNRKTYYPAHQLLAVAVQGTWALTRAALSIPADVVHVGKPHPMNGLAGLIAKYAQNKCVFVDCDDYEAASNRFSGKWQRWGVSFFENMIPRRVHHVTTHNHFLLDRLLASGVPRERITLLPNGVDARRFAEPDSAEVEALRRELGLGSRRVVAFIGSLSSPSHPIQLLLGAFERVHESHPESTLMIVGGGEDYESLKGKSKEMGLGDAVVFCGRVPGAKVPVYYGLADVAVDPVYDNDAARGRLPLKLFESWASGTPFVTGDVGDRRRILGAPPAGMVVQPGSAEALAKGILEVLLDPSQMEALRQRGQERVKDYYWSRLAGTMEASYLKVASQSGSISR
jgi:glycosyltransferase involved in cell wall biosynthesis